jgi:transposase
MHRLGEDVAERLDVTPAQFRVIVTRRPRYGCRACESAVVQAPAPARLIEGGLPTEALVAHVLVGKYADHLPLYRQSQIYGRQGTELDRSTLADWVRRAAAELRPVYERLLEHLKHLCRLPGARRSRARRRPGDARLLLVRWSHVRRRFYEIVLGGNSPIAEAALQRINRPLPLRDNDPWPCARAAASRPPRAKQAPRRRPADLARIAEAIRYALKLWLWSGLRLFLDDGRIEIDTNVVERAIRPIALNCKNALFAGSDQGGVHWGVIASLIETCKLNAVDPQAYLAEVLSRLVNRHPAGQIDQLSPGPTPTKWPENSAYALTEEVCGPSALPPFFGVRRSGARTYSARSRDNQLEIAILHPQRTQKRQRHQSLIDSGDVGRALQRERVRVGLMIQGEANQDRQLSTG